MKVLLSESQIKVLFENIIEQEDIGEIATKKKRKLGEGLYHDVYESIRYPDKVFKIGRENSVKEAYEYFVKYPYLFPHVYGYKKWGDKKDPGGVNDLYFMLLEKLDTQKFVDFWNELNEISGQFTQKTLYTIAYNFYGYEEGWMKILQYLDNENHELFDQTLEFYNLLKELNEIYESPDVHNGQFGYDKNGVLKCLDF
jgi:hypothetical protein